MTEKSTLLPLIRKILPDVIAQEIISVQPMISPVAPPYVILENHFPPAPEGHLIIEANFEISSWIQNQPIHMWKWHEDWAAPPGKDRFYISKKLYTLLSLKWT